ncbi:MAG: hypothetical protein WA080_01150 [Sulfuricurvum sp.]
MRQRPSFFWYAFFMAFLLHGIVALMLLFIQYITPKIVPKEAQETRFNVSLKEPPQAKKEVVIDHPLPKPRKTTPTPTKGTQHTIPTPIATPVAEAKPKEEPPQPVEPIKPKGLYEFLSQADPNAAASLKPAKKVDKGIRDLYGDKFDKLSEGEKKYIQDHQGEMQRITQGVLDRYGPSAIPNNLRADETNLIEFYLYPDGHISDIKYLRNSHFAVLDDTTKKTIEYAYSKYPRPEQKTYIRYRFIYNLRGGRL